MKVAIDLQPLFSDSSMKRGIGNYTRSQIDTMISNPTQIELVMLGYGHPGVTGLALDWNNYFSFNAGPKGVFLFPMLRRTFGKRLIANFLRYFKPDIFHFTSPFDCFNIFDIDWYKDVRKVATVYDVIPYLFQEQYLSNSASRHFYLERVKFLKNMDLILAISSSVKEDLVKHLGFSEDKIQVIYGGIDRDFKKLDTTELNIEAVKTKYQINGEYILCTGGADFRKNLERLIQAVSILPGTLKAEIKLVIVCKLSQSQITHLRNVAKQFGVLNNLVLTNYVPKEELIQLYNGAKAFVFPSLYEGFGLPLLEAMACGIPVVTSNQSCLPEVAGNAAIYVNPYDEEDISRGIQRVITDRELARQQVSEGFKRVEYFTWEKVAQKTFECYNSLALPKKSIHLTKKNFKIALFISESNTNVHLGTVNSQTSDIQVDSFSDRSVGNIAYYLDFDQSNIIKGYDLCVFWISGDDFPQWMNNLLDFYSGVIIISGQNLSMSENELQSIGMAKAIIVHSKTAQMKLLNYCSNIPIQLVDVSEDYSNIIKDTIFLTNQRPLLTCSEDVLKFINSLASITLSEDELTSLSRTVHQLT